MQYTQDYDERMPGATGGPSPRGEGKLGGWIFYSVYGNGGVTGAFDPSKGSLFPYVKSAQVYVCPSDSMGQKAGNSYSANDCIFTPEIGGTGLYGGRSLASFDEQSKWLLLTEEVNGSPLAPIQNTSSDDGFLYYGTGNGMDGTANAIGQRHFDGANVSFMDGHVKWLKIERIGTDNLRSGGTGTCK